MSKVVVRFLVGLVPGFPINPPTLIRLVADPVLVVPPLKNPDDMSSRCQAESGGAERHRELSRLCVRESIPAAALAAGGCASAGEVLLRLCAVGFFVGWFLGPPVVPLYPVFGEGSPTKINYRKKKQGTLILTSPLEDLGLVCLVCWLVGWGGWVLC